MAGAARTAAAASRARHGDARRDHPERSRDRRRRRGRSALVRAWQAPRRGRVRPPDLGAPALRPRVPLRRIQEALDVDEPDVRADRRAVEAPAMMVHFTIGIYTKKGEQEEWT